MECRDCSLLIYLLKSQAFWLQIQINLNEAVSLIFKRETISKNVERKKCHTLNKNI